MSSRRVWVKSSSRLGWRGAVDASGRGWASALTRRPVAGTESARRSPERAHAVGGAEPADPDAALVAMQPGAEGAEALAVPDLVHILAQDVADDLQALRVAAAGHDVPVDVDRHRVV